MNAQVARYKFRFISTTQDLLDAEEADRTLRTVRAPFRWILNLFGLAWLAAGIFAFGASIHSFKSIIWVLIGSGILYWFGFRTLLQRRRIRLNNVPEQEVLLEFFDDRITAEESKAGHLTKCWSALLDVKYAPRGILFYFDDGFVRWLPERLFDDEGARSEFTSFLAERLVDE